MNERIKELAEQAGFFPKPNWDHTGWHAAGHNDSFEKITELIVLESVRYFNEDYQRDFDTPWREDLAKGIKKHFGVE